MESSGTLTRVRSLTNQYHIVPNATAFVELVDELGHSRDPLRLSDRSRMERPDHGSKFRQVVPVEGAQHRLEGVEIVGVGVLPADGVDEVQRIQTGQAVRGGKLKGVEETVKATALRLAPQ